MLCGSNWKTNGCFQLGKLIFPWHQLENGSNLDALNLKMVWTWFQLENQSNFNFLNRNVDQSVPIRNKNINLIFRIVSIISISYYQKQRFLSIRHWLLSFIRSRFRVSSNQRFTEAKRDIDANMITLRGMILQAAAALSQTNTVHTSPAVQTLKFESFTEKEESHFFMGKIKFWFEIL